MDLRFEWNGEKAKGNLKKHGVSFIEAASVFDDLFSVVINDPLHSVGEFRFLAIGLSDRQRLLVVSFTERENRTRIISARVAKPLERRVYEQGI
jgi:uncharacterized protein